MRIVTIHIPRSAVMYDVTQLTAYLAVKHPDSEALCDRVPVVPADDEILDAAWRIGCAQLDLCLRHRMMHSFDCLQSACQSSCQAVAAPPSVWSGAIGDRFRKAYSATLSIPRRICKSQVADLQTIAQAYLTATVAASWLSVALPEAENKYAAEAQRCIRMMDSAIACRRRRIQVI